MAPNESLNFDLDARLAAQRERNLGVQVPIPLSERLDSLSDGLYVEGYGRVARKELLAALLLSAPENSEELADLLTRYRKARVREAVIGVPPTAHVIAFPRRSPGPRSRS